MTWNEMCAVLLGFQGRECMAQVWKPEDDPVGHLPILTTTGVLRGRVAQEIGGSETVIMSVGAGSLILQERFFGAASQRDPSSLTIAYVGLEVGIVAQGDPAPPPT